MSMAVGSKWKVSRESLWKVNKLFCQKITRKNAGYVVRGYHYSRAGKHQEELFPQRLTLPENRGYVPMLSPSQVTSILTQLETSVAGNGPVKSFDSNLLASNNPTEDRRAAAQLVQTGGGLFGVFDGHGGSACAQSVSERLFSYIAVSLLSTDQFEQYSQQMRSESPPQLVNKYRFREDYISEDLLHIYVQGLQRYVTETLSFSGDDVQLPSSIVEQLSTAFVRLDWDISQEALPSARAVDTDLLQVAMSGACTCVAHINDSEIDVASVGDCRAVVGRLSANGTWTALPLTVDQNVDNTAEVRRVLESHPKGEWSSIIKNDRLLGLLVPLRAFGDIRFKWSKSDLQSLASVVTGSRLQSLIPSHYQTPPYLTAEPEVSRHTLRHNDRFMVIATDGLWDMMSSQEAVDIVGDHMIGKLSRSQNVKGAYEMMTLGEIAQILHERQRGLAHESTDNNGATHLIRHALGFEHRKVSEMLTFPPAVARHYRDDITVIIVYFDVDFLNTRCGE